MPDRAGTLKVLIVDDESVIADTLASIFGQRHCETRAVYSAEQALEAVVDWQPSVAIIDIILPNMNGIDLAKALQAQDPSVEVLLITGRIVGDLLADSKAYGGFNVLMKPVPVAVLLENTERLLAKLRSPTSPLRSQQNEDVA